MTKKILAVLSGVITAAALLPMSAAAADAGAREQTTVTLAGAAAPQAVPGQVLTRQHADLKRSGGSTVPAQFRIDALSVDIVAFDELLIEADVELGGYADEVGLADVEVLFGHESGGQCVAAPAAAESTVLGTLGSVYLSGSTPDRWGPRPASPWTCVVARTLDRSTGAQIDFVAGPLTNSYAAPKLSISKPTVLGKKVKKKLKVAKGGWTPVQVEVANTGTVKVGRVTVTGKGKGLKVKKSVLDPIADKSSSSAVLMVKPVGKKKAKKLTVTAKAAGGVVARIAVKAKTVKAPKKAVAGQYRSTKGKAVNFRIRENRITGFTVRTQTRCGGYGSIPTYQYSAYDVPKTKIPRNGIVYVTARGKASGSTYSTHLQLQVKGKKITRGLFRYIGPANCSAVETFKAKRIGR